MLRNRIPILILFALAILSANLASASFRIISTNTNVYLGSNTTAQVSEVVNVYVSNSSYATYNKDRLALNLSLSEWQSLFGDGLVQHIVNPESGVYGFEFLPGPLIRSGDNYTASILMSYYVKNVTTVQNIAPRVFDHPFNDKVFIFEHAASGEVLSNNTMLTIVLPKGSTINYVYPTPDSPATGISDNYKNITTLSWNNGEPLGTFRLGYDTEESLQGEVGSFFTAVYNYLGLFTYIIIIVIILLIIIYTYFKASR
jgi:hypothetical protein